VYILKRLNRPPPSSVAGESIHPVSWPHIIDQHNTACSLAPGNRIGGPIAVNGRSRSSGWDSRQGSIVTLNRCHTGIEAGRKPLVEFKSFKKRHSPSWQAPFQKFHHPQAAIVMGQFVPVVGIELWQGPGYSRVRR